MWFWSLPATTILAKWTDDSIGERNGRYAWDWPNRVDLKCWMSSLLPDRIWACVWCHSLGTHQQLDGDKKILWIIYIMDVLELCFLWNRSISGCVYAFSTSSASAKTIVCGCFESKSSSLQNALFNVIGFYPAFPLAMGLIMTNAMWQWAHVHRTHWSQHDTYHYEAAGLTLEWHLENATMVPTLKLYCWRLEWHPLLLDQVIWNYYVILFCLEL